MRFRTLFGLLIPLASAALFARFGVWQVRRHAERAELNLVQREKLSMPPVPFEALSRDSVEGLTGDSAELLWRRVTLRGRFRYDLEQVLAGRSSEGSPGVHLLTPLEREGSDTLVLVTRGWVYSADAASVDRARWKEADRVEVAGYAVPIAAEGLPAPTDPGRPLRAINLAALRTRLGRPAAATQVIMTSDSAARADSVPRRLPPPTVDAGPHRSYAIQWFSFALIALAGGVLLFRRGLAADNARPT